MSLTIAWVELVPKNTQAGVWTTTIDVGPLGIPPLVIRVVDLNGGPTRLFQRVDVEGKPSWRYEEQ